MTKVDRTMHILSFISLFALAAFVLISNALCSLIHIFVIIPAVYFLYRIIVERELRLTGSQVSLLLLVLFGAISIIASPDMENKVKAISKLKYFLVGFLAIFAYGYTFTNWLKNKHIKFLLTIFAVSVSIASISGAIGVFTGFNPLRMKPSGPRSSGAYGMIMTYGYGMQFVLVMYLGMLIYYSDIKGFINRNLLIIATIIGLVGLYLSYTRGAMVGLICAVPFLFYKKSKKTFIALMATAALLIVSVGTIMLMGGNENSRFLLDAKAGTNIKRIAQYKAAWYAFKESPLTGIGYRNFEKNSVAIKKKYKIGDRGTDPGPIGLGENYFGDQDFAGHAHNNFFELLAGAGIGGFIALVMFHLFWFFEMWRRNDIFGKIGPGFVVALFVSGQFQNTITDSENMYLIMSVYALSQIGMYRKKFVESRVSS